MQEYVRWQSLQKTVGSGRTSMNNKEVEKLKPHLQKHWKDGKLLCASCKNYLTIDNFCANADKPYREYKDTRCRICKTRANKERRLLRDPLEKLIIERVAGARVRARKSNIYFDITVDNIKKLWNLQDGKCAISGIDMTYTLGEGRTHTNISIDQIEASKGYTVDNIQLVCMAVNQMKSDLSNDNLLMFCIAIIKKMELNKIKRKRNG